MVSTKGIVSVYLHANPSIFSGESPTSNEFSSKVLNLGIRFNFKCIQQFSRDGRIWSLFDQMAVLTENFSCEFSNNFILDIIYGNMNTNTCPEC